MTETTNTFTPLQDPSSKFRNSTGGRYTKALFLEESEDKSVVLYTLKDRDWAGYPSLYRLYMEMEDPIEFTFANTYFDSYEHWQTICKASWFKPLIERWRNELELQIRSKALERLRKDATSPSRSAAASNRYLLERGWIDKPTKGRPSKEAIKIEATRLAQLDQTLEDDLSRILRNSDDRPN